MHAFIRNIAAALGISVLSLALLWDAGGATLAQPRSAVPEAEAVSTAPPVEQMALSETQVQGLVAAQKDINAVDADLPEQQSDKPDPIVQAKLDGIARKHGFADYTEFDKVLANISLVLAGFDPQTKTYVGQEAVIKKQMASLNADSEVPPLDKKKAIAELQEALKTVTPIKYPDNLKLVSKYYDKLSEAMQED